jgi:hypothetical protein
VSPPRQKLKPHSCDCGSARPAAGVVRAPTAGTAACPPSLLSLGLSDAGQAVCCGAINPDARSTAAAGCFASSGDRRGIRRPGRRRRPRSRDRRWRKRRRNVFGTCRQPNDHGSISPLPPSEATPCPDPREAAAGASTIANVREVPSSRQRRGNGDQPAGFPVLLGA